MKKTLYLVALSLITAGCIIWRVGTGVYGWMSDHGDKYMEVAKERESVEENDLEAFEKIDIDIDVSDINIQTGDSYGISIEAPKDYMMKYKVENGVLNVTQPGNHQIYNTNSMKISLIVTIPKGTDFSDITVKGDVGSIYVDGIKTNNFQGTMDVGKIKISDSDLGTCNVDADTGDVELENTKFMDCKVYADIGEVKIDSPETADTYRMDLSADVGNVKVNDKNCGMDYTTSTGSYELTIESSVGDVRVEFAK